MKPITLLAAIALNLFAQDPNAKIGCLVRSDAKAAYGMDVERYQSSKLSEMFPLWYGQAARSPFPVTRVIVALSDISGANSSVLILQGTSFSAQTLMSLPGQENSLPTFQGFPALLLSPGSLLSPDSLLVVLSSTTAVMGETASVSEVVDRWSQVQCPGEITSRIGDLNGSYDAWFIALRPLEQLSVQGLLPEGSLRAELAQSIEEIHGGIRVGAIHSVRVEVTTKNPEDASALATLARWLPAMVASGNNPESQLVEAVENFQTQASGRTASLSFQLPEVAVEGVLKAREKKAFDVLADQ